MTDLRIKLSDGSSWPRPALESDDEASIEWKLRYTPDNLTKGDLLAAAGIISAYGYLVVEANRDKVALVRREIRAALEQEKTP